MLRNIFRNLLAILLIAAPLVAAAQSSLDLFLKAVNEGDTQTVASYLSKGLDPNTADAEGNTVLMLAARSGKLPMVELLLDRKASVTKRSPHGDSPLMFASLKGHLEIVKLLVDRGAQINHDGWAPIHYAAFENRAAVLNYLIEKGADKNALAPNGYTALMLAARGGHIDAAKTLLQWDADFAIKGPGEETALKIALARKDDELQKLLRRAGAAE